MVEKKREFEVEIDLKEIFFFIWRRAWIVVLATIIGFTAGYTISRFFITPKYVADSKVFIINKSQEDLSASYSDIQMSTLLTNDYREVVKSRPVLDEVIRNLGLPYSTSELSHIVSVNIPTGTRILHIVVEHSDPIAAMNIANELQSATAIGILNVMTDVEVNEMEKAILPTSPSSPNILQNSILFAAIGAFIVIGIMTLIFVSDDTIKTSEDVEKYLAINVLGIIPDNQAEEKAQDRLKKKTDREKRKIQKLEWNKNAPSPSSFKIDSDAVSEDTAFSNTDASFEAFADAKSTTNDIDSDKNIDINANIATTNNANTDTTDTDDRVDADSGTDDDSHNDTDMNKKNKDLQEGEVND